MYEVIIDEVLWTSKILKFLNSESATDHVIIIWEKCVCECTCVYDMTWKFSHIFTSIGTSTF